MTFKRNKIKKKKGGKNKNKNLHKPEAFALKKK